MKYTYAYKTSDGSRHEASIEAASRDEAFALLRKEGIRPIKVVAADGAKANGEIRGVRKRVVAAIVALVAVAVVAAVRRVRRKGGCGGCSGNCAACGAACRNRKAERKL